MTTTGALAAPGAPRGRVSRVVSDGRGAMWTDVVTGRSPKTAKITGADREANWLAMNVIRIGLPAGSLCSANEPG